MPPLTEDQYKEVAEARERRSVTARATSAALEEIMYEPFPILDNGFVRVVDYMGDDNAVVQAARVSYGKGTKQVSDDRGLIRYLMRHRHTTPFELASIKLHVKAPIFVTRQWFRHRTASINEYSARYSVLDREFYVPDVADVGLQSLDNRQGSGMSADGNLARTVVERLKEDSSRAYESYLWMLNEDGTGDEVEPGRGRIARELARTTLPVSIYTQFYWQVNLWNLLNFLNLRASPGAQHEIRLYANAILEAVARWVPIVHEAFNDYVMQAASLSSQQLALVRAALASDGPVDASSFRVSGREARELISIIPEISSRLKKA